jgi:hypothetical protein
MATLVAARLLRPCRRRGLVGKAVWSNTVRGVKLLQGLGDTGAHRVTLRGGGDSKQGAGGDSTDSESRPPAVGSGSSEVPVGNLGRR